MIPLLVWTETFSLKDFSHIQIQNGSSYHTCCRFYLVLGILSCHYDNHDHTNNIYCLVKLCLEMSGIAHQFGFDSNGLPWNVTAVGLSVYFAVVASFYQYDITSSNPHFYQV